MSINLSIRWSHPGATSAFIRYARVDNVGTPTYVVVSPNKVVTPNTTSVSVAENVPNGQYEIQATPIYPDGRVCAPTSFYTLPCDGLIAIAAYINGGNIIVEWTAPSYIPKGRITVTFPNGSTSQNNYSNISTINNTVIPIPPGNSGNITVQGQSVCDESSYFYSQYSNSITLSNDGGLNPVSGSYRLGNNIGTMCNETSTLLWSNGAFAIGKILYTDSGLTNPITGYTYISAGSSATIYTLSSTTGEILSDSGQSCSVTISNTILTNNYKINSVTGISGFTFPGGGVPSVGIGYTYVGTRTPIGTFTIGVDVSSNVGASGSVKLFKNGVLADCKPVSGNGTYTFGATGFIATDTIEIRAEAGSC